MSFISQNIQKEKLKCNLLFAKVFNPFLLCQTSVQLEGQCSLCVLKKKPLLILKNGGKTQKIQVAKGRLL